MPNMQKYIIRDHIKLGGIDIPVPSTYVGIGITAVFTISLKAAKKIINSSQLVPAKLSSDKAVINITVFDFHTSPIGPYTELVYSIPVLYKPKINLPIISLLLNKHLKNFGVFVVDIMQSTKIAIQHGNLLTGYPHNTELIDVQFEKIDHELSVTVRHGLKTILTLRAETRSRRKDISQTYMTYFEKPDSSAYRIQMDVYGNEQKVDSCRLSTSNDNLADVLRSLKIGQNSIRAMYYPNVTEINPVELKKL